MKNRREEEKRGEERKGIADGKKRKEETRIKNKNKRRAEEKRK